MLTVEQVSEWVGRRAQDPYGADLGTIVGLLGDAEGGQPEWAVVAPPGAAEAAVGDDVEGAVAPLRGAEPTGRQIRLADVAAVIAQAPRVRAGQSLTPAQLAAVRARYGIADGGAPIEAVAPPPRRQLPSGPDPARRGAVIALLRRAHALEQSALRRLAAMRRRARDEELVHDLALHAVESERHAALVRERLRQLGGRRAPLRDLAAKAGALLASQPPRLRRAPEPRDALAAIAFERREAALYRRLERLAADAGDARTAQLARAIAADEVAMEATLAANWMRWTQTGPHAVGSSPFAPPADLAEQAPRT